MQVLKLKKATFQHIESELYSYHETKRELIQLQNDVMFQSTRQMSEGRGNLPGDPTARVALALVTHRRIEQLTQIIEAIESVYNRLEPDKQRLVELRYWTKSRVLTWEGIANELYASRRTLIYWRDGIIKAIAECLGRR